MTTAESEPYTGELTDLDRIHIAAGFAITPEGKVAARRRRLEAEARWTPEKRAALRKRLGFPEKTA
jgi:hypothetical protein